MRPTHLLILLIVLIVLFGANKLPDLARSVGQSLKIFKKEISELQEDSSPQVPAQPQAAPAATPAPAAAVQSQPEPAAPAPSAETESPSSP